MEHHQHPTPNNSKVEKYLGEFVYGGIDGCVTTFAVVSGAVGAGLDTSIILILGFANLFADGLSMSIGAFLAAQSEQFKFDKHQKIEYDAVRQFPEEEKNEIREIYRKKGFEGELLEQVVEVITSDEDRWVNDMMKEELEMIEEEKSAFWVGFFTFLSFLAIGLIPLSVYVIDFISPRHFNLFLWSSILTGMGFIIIGWVKTKVTETSRVKGIAETLLLGASAALVSYFVGDFLEQLIAG